MAIGTVYTSSDSLVGTTHYQEEPRGFGISPFGDPDTVDKEYRTEGWSDPLTNYRSYTDD